jgi:nicotinamide phosphoribosyltransferase
MAIRATNGSPIIGDNVILLTDSYKLTHWKQYPPKTQKVYSYFESRGGKFDETLMFGLQYIVQRYLAGQAVTKEMIDDAEALCEAHLGSKELFNRRGWEYILKRYNGQLPVSIKAVPEGTVVGTHNALITVENTDPECYWLTNYIETLLVEAWYPITVATLSMHMKKLMIRYLGETGDPSLVCFKLHDFGFRGVSSVESAAIGGAAHLINYKGTDTLVAIEMLMKYYGSTLKTMPGFSIPAAEHSTITAWLRKNEAKAYLNMLEKFPKGLVAVVSDSYDIYNACRNIWGKKLREKVKGRDGTVVVRPDSGRPEKVVVGIMEILGKQFGYTTNAKGYKVLDEHIRVIQGDGIDYESTGRILKAMKEAGWSADNLSFGMGGALLQKLHRDTQKFAFKCAYAVVDGEGRDVFKKPVTDPGKNSKRGLMKLVADEKLRFRTVKRTEPGTDQLVEMFRNGKLLRTYNTEEIRERAESFLRREEPRGQTMKETASRMTSRA